jgi:uncharacterized protein (DUF1778 family)
MSATPKDERLDLRLKADHKRTIEQAAALTGQSVSTFTLDATLRRARRVIRDVQVIELSDRDRDRVLAALDGADAPPNAAMLRAIGRHKALLG